MTLDRFATEVHIRRAVAQDEPALRQIVEAAYAGYSSLGINLPPVAEGLDADIRNRIVWVAAEGDTILGGLVLALHGDYGHLMNVAVDPAAAGRGVGRRLMDRAEVQVRDAGLSEMRLATHRDLGGNVSLYEHLGWSIIGTDGSRVQMVKSMGDTKGQ